MTRIRFCLERSLFGGIAVSNSKKEKDDRAKKKKKKKRRMHGELNSKRETINYLTCSSPLIRDRLI